MSDNIPRQMTARRGFSLSYKGKNLLSTIDPVSQGERLVQNTPKTERTLYLCPSPLYGYGLSALLDALPQDSAILCVEADSELFAFSKKAMADLLGKAPSLIKLIKSDDPALVCAFIHQVWGKRRFRRVEVLRLSLGWQLFPAVYESLAEAISRHFASDWSNAATLMKLGRRYMLNAVRNLSLFARSRSLSELSFGNAPILVLGAGPSLDYILEGLAKVAGSTLSDRNFKIVCADTALRALFERGIKPDLAVALECQHWNLQDFTGLGNWEIPLAMDFSALPQTHEALGSEIFLFVTPWTSLRFFKRLKEAMARTEIIPPLGSVGLTATEAARRLSSGTIVTGALDFSYTMDVFHARSTPSRLEKLRRQNRFKSLIDAESAFRYGSFDTHSKLGEVVRTNLTLKNYRDIFEAEFAGCENILDISTTGLDLGLKALSLEDAIEILQRKDISTDEIVLQDCIDGNKAETVMIFINQEKERLVKLRDALMGTESLTRDETEILLDECDYLWAHFPDCAGTDGRRPSAENISFLNRVRIEIEPILNRFELALKELKL